MSTAGSTPGTDIVDAIATARALTPAIMLVGRTIAANEAAVPGMRAVGGG